MMFVPKGEHISATAKARVRKGTLFDGNLYRCLLECSQISDVARMLMSTYYARYLPPDTETLHRDRFEFLLINIISSEVQSFFSPAGLERRAFLKLWFERQDILLLKRKIWEIYAGKTDSNTGKEAYKDLSSLIFFLVDKQKLLSSTSIDEVIASIRNEKLAVYMEETMKHSVGATSPAPMIEFALDVYQNRRLFEAANSFSGEERERLHCLIGMDIDIMNIISIFRGKKYFNMSDEAALSMVFYSNYRVDLEMLRQIASLPPERMWEPLMGTQYASLLPIEEEKDELSAVGLTSRSRSIERENALRTFQSGSTGIHLVLAYLILREIEILDISAIIEIVRYNYDRKKAGRFLAYPLTK